MNETLQKRIEKAANKICCTDCPFENIRNCKECVEKENAIKTATFVLQNQWISVGEALPEVDGHGYSEPVLVMSDTNELLVATYSEHYDKWNAVGPVSYHRLVVTHWMPIPELEGGEDDF